MYTLVFTIKLKLINDYAICFLIKGNIGYIPGFIN
jgi:hypothetical protein